MRLTRSGDSDREDGDLESEDDDLESEDAATSSERRRVKAARKFGFVLIEALDVQTVYAFCNDLVVCLFFLGGDEVQLQFKFFCNACNSRTKALHTKEWFAYKGKQTTLDLEQCYSLMTRSLNIRDCRETVMLVAKTNSTTKMKKMPMA